MQKAKIYQFPIRRQAKPAARAKSAAQLQNGQQWLATMRKLIEEGQS